MQTALRKMGNSVGMIVPKAVLKELGISAGTVMNVQAQDSKIVATPLHYPRAGWAEEAAAVAAAEEDPDEAAWRAVGNEGDAELTR